MPRYKDPELNAWRDANVSFTLTTNETIEQELNKIEHKHLQEARALFITLWASAARPNEVLNLKRSDVKKEGTNLSIRFPASKGSNARALFFPLSNPYAKEAWAHIQKVWDWQYLFLHFRAERSKKHKVYKLIINTNQETGEKTKEKQYYYREYPSLAQNLIYWFKKWGLRTPYYYRHNRMTIAAETLPVRQLQELKGAKKEDSVYCYLRSTKKSKERIAKTLFK